MARVDAWCWSVRLFKSRSLATAAAKGGHIRVNGARAKPAQMLKVGDEVRVVTDREHIMIVRELLHKRVGAPHAALAYEDRTPALPPKPERTAPAFQRDRGAGRPTKRDRRLLERLRSMDD